LAFLEAELKGDQERSIVKMRHPRWPGGLSRRRGAEKQIRFGDDRQKGKNRGKSQDGG